MSERNCSTFYCQSIENLRTSRKIHELNELMTAHLGHVLVKRVLGQLFAVARQLLEILNVLQVGNVLLAFLVGFLQGHHIDAELQRPPPKPIVGSVSGTL